jgi:hypothetical protein
MGQQGLQFTPGVWCLSVSCLSVHHTKSDLSLHLESGKSWRISTPGGVVRASDDGVVGERCLGIISKKNLSMKWML